MLRVYVGSKFPINKFLLECYTKETNVLAISKS